ncbi:non-canonical purine NTP pyrophosphatase [Pigmentibacter sp. JX0631]|uniref:non-canonical purine NTP pyrophosphatase n=1 Tax=Pigmentibacter sp. JX0631 TaxID=2976982 RepID=UPI0024690EF3|nr:non-canonical purine NTP pyrophosphatase [Pigmentibacter sp. JX0631]WGL61392.1 non-canonical purine NTP pyrophosphatase [Pigmentibacter sp. JX0631]
MSILIFTGNSGKLSEFKNMISSKEEIIGLSELAKITEKNLPEADEDSDLFSTNAFIKLYKALEFLYTNKDLKSVREIKSIIVDDSGLCVPKLGFLPGVHSATFGGLPRSDTNNRRKLSSEINKIVNLTNDNEYRLQAFFVCFLFEIKIHDLEKFSFIKNNSFIQASQFINSSLESFERKLLESVNLSNIGDYSTSKLSFNDFHPSFPTENLVDIYFGYCCGEVSNLEQNLIPGAGHGYDSQFYSNAFKNLSFASITLEDKNKISHRAFAMEALNKSYGKSK